MGIIEEVKQLQNDFHAYLTPHPELGKDMDERGCVGCWLIATHLYALGWRANGAIPTSERRDSETP